MTDTAIYIQYGPLAGDICRWENADIVVLPVQVVASPVPSAHLTSGV